MKKSFIVVLLLALSLVLTLSASALADDVNTNEAIVDINTESNDESIMPLRYTLIDMITATLELNNGTADCIGTVTTKEEVYKIQITMTLQKYSGGDWIEHITWSRTAYNTDEFFLAKYPSVGSGSYRVHVVGTVTPYEGSSETQTATTDPLP